LHVLQSPKSRININSESLWKLKVSYCFLVIKFMFKYGIDDMENWLWPLKGLHSDSSEYCLWYFFRLFVWQHFVGLYN
jgi:hypothetical protein